MPENKVNEILEELVKNRNRFEQHNSPFEGTKEIYAQAKAQLREVVKGIISKKEYCSQHKNNDDWFIASRESYECKCCIINHYRNAVISDITQRLSKVFGEGK